MQKSYCLKHEQTRIRGKHEKNFKSHKWFTKVFDAEEKQVTINVCGFVHSRGAIDEKLSSLLHNFICFWGTINTDDAGKPALVDPIILTPASFDSSKRLMLFSPPKFPLL